MELGMWPAHTYKLITKYFIRHVINYKHGGGAKY